MDFVREQGVVGLAVGFVLGGAVAKLVSAFVEDLINPLLGIVLGAAEGLETLTFAIGPAVFKVGAFLGVLIDFVVIAIVVYGAVRILKLDQADKKKE